MKKNKMLIICGPTAIGKTRLTLRLAKKLKGELVSADSRQVYKGMDIGTGKDIPKDYRFKISDLRFKKNKIGYYTDGEIKIWGYDLVAPTEEFSVAEYINIVRKVVEDIWKRKKLSILVGGTGLYIKGVIDGIDTSIIPKNEKLRKSLGRKSADELFELLTGLDPVKTASLNVSDRRNPRRLVRAIEIAQTNNQKKRTKTQNIGMDTMFVGLKVAKRGLDKLIEDRVDWRMKNGFEDELKGLLDKGTTWNMQSMSSLGYQQYKDYAFGRVSKDVAISNWKQAEKKYAKRQMTWFKRDKRINWFDVSKSGWQQNVENLVNKWYSSSGDSSSKN